MWYLIIRTIAVAEHLDVELWEKWDRPTTPGFLIDLNRQLSILDATRDIVFTKPEFLTNNKELASRFHTVRRVVLVWNVVGISVILAFIIWWTIAVAIRGH
jgi:hypothetical protein